CLVHAGSGISERTHNELESGVHALQAELCSAELIVETHLCGVLLQASEGASGLRLRVGSAEHALAGVVHGSLLQAACAEQEVASLTAIRAVEAEALHEGLLCEEVEILERGTVEVGALLREGAAETSRSNASKLGVCLREILREAGECGGDYRLPS